jgi:MerR family transcriptional regulator/heat shock protein HspR
MGNTRLYSERDIALLRRVKALMDELGVNLAGIEVILRMSQHMAKLQSQIKQMESELKKLRKGSEL